MVRNSTVCQSLATAINESPELDASIREALTISTVEFDAEGEHANVQAPAVELVARDQMRMQPTNTDLVGYTTDDQGRRNGRVYETLFDTTIAVTTITSQVDPFDGHRISHGIERTLRPYTDVLGEQALPDPRQGEPDPLEQIERVTQSSLSPTHDFGMTPTMRRWELTYRLVFTDCIVTQEAPIETVITPDDIDRVDDEGRLVFDVQA